MTTVMIEKPTDNMDGKIWTVNLAQQPILLPYPGRFPVTETFLNALAELESEMRAKYEPEAVEESADE